MWFLGNQNMMRRFKINFGRFGATFLNKNSKMKIFATGLVAIATAAPEVPQQATPLSIGSPAIIGGKNASDGQFPWQVTLARSSGSHYCGGSILAPTKVSVFRAKLMAGDGRRQSQDLFQSVRS